MREAGTEEEEREDWQAYKDGRPSPERLAQERCGWPPESKTSWYMEKANVAKSHVELRSDATSSMPGVRMDDANVPTSATPAIVYVWNQFRAGDQL